MNALHLIPSTLLYLALSLALSAADPAPTNTPAAPLTNSLHLLLLPIPASPTLVAACEIRVSDYTTFTAATQRPHSPPSFPQASNHPVVNVTWEDASAFCRWLTERERTAGTLPKGTRYRLPTDAEWSAAAGLTAPAALWPEQRLQLSIAWPWGTQWPPSPGTGNYSPSLAIDSLEFTAPVASFPPNPLGFHDLGGNVWEWCDDWFNEARVTKALRGASYHDAQPRDLLAAYRFSGTVHLDNDDIGFRIALAPE